MIEIRCFDISQLRPGDYKKLYDRASPQRQSRADRYLKMDDRIRCVVADALLGMIPEFSAGNLDRTAAGKPYLKDQEQLQFNLSHSGRWVVAAWGSTPLGVDVEQVRMDEGKETLARRYFCSDEQAYIFCASAQERARRFFRIWTMKESYLKYLGTGINRPLHSFSVLTDQLEVHMITEYLPDACMTVCSKDDITNCRMITRQQLLAK